MLNFSVYHTNPSELSTVNEIHEDYSELYKYTKILEEYIKNHTSHRILVCPKCGKLFPYGFGCTCGYDYQPDRAYIEITGFNIVYQEYVLFETELDTLDNIDNIIPWSIILQYIKHFDIKFNNTNVETIDELKSYFHKLLNHINDIPEHTGINDGFFDIHTDYNRTKYKIKVSAHPDTYTYKK